MATETLIDGRLPSIAVPSHYDLFYKHIDLKRHTFDGTVSIRLTVPNGATEWPRFSIVLHALDLNIVAAKLKRISIDHSWEAEEVRYVKKDQTCEIVFGSESQWVEEASYVLTVDFVGILNDLMRGLYRSTYVGLDGATHTMATTQFEATDARRAFPCLDEPALKATFTLSVTIPSSLECISNTPSASVHTKFEKDATTKTITFQTTPKMSTYLLALVVGQFDCVSKTSGNIQTTVYTVPGKAHQGEFCLDTAVRCLDLFQELFGVPYPLGKSDLLAIPDFAAGAMENWGCVTYREAKVLVKEGATSETLKRGIARTVCHELAHQWFGNLVTMEFWTQLWLKEGVARFMEFVGIDSLFPEWNAWTEFVQSVYGLAQSLDAMKSSHPVEVEVKHSDEIDEIFDAISYAKGASLIRMISSHIGFDVFLQGMKNYLKEHAYGNTTTELLWQALEDASGTQVVDLMTPWTSQLGFPVLVLPETVDGQVETPRFLASGPGSNEDVDAQVWPIPVTALVEGSTETHGTWIINGPSGDDSAELLDHIRKWTAEGKWFKLNVNQTGFYRVIYTKDQWSKLGNVMSPDGPLSLTDRLGLLSDSFAAGRAGYASIVDSLSLVLHFGEHYEAEYVVWQELSENLAGLASLYRSEPFFERYQNFLRAVYSKHMDRLGWEASAGESQRMGTLRATIISMLGVAGDANVLEQSYKRFCEYAANPEASNVPGDLQQIMFRNALRHNEEEVYPMLKSIYENSTFPEEQRNCLSVLGAVKDMTRHEEMLEYTLFSGKVRLQDIAFSLGSLSSTTDEGGRACWNLLKDRIGEIHSQFGVGPMWGAVCGLACRGLKTHAEADEVEAFFSNPAHPPGSAKRRLTQALEAVRTKATRLERDREDVTVFLEAY
jgi:aminopeptidase N